MRVTVKLFGEFRAALGRDEVALELPAGTTAGAALRALAAQEPLLEPLLFSRGALRDHLHLFVNGRNVAHLQGLGTPLAPGDTLTFFSPLSGG